MTPDFRIIADSKDITDAVRDRLLDLVVTDEAGIQSDTVSISLDDRRRGSGVAQLPRIGTSLTISMGYKERSLFYMGTYLVDEIEISSPPATVTVTGKAANMPNSFRSPKTRSWDETTVGAVVGAIAGEHGYAPAVDPALAAKAIVHLDQTEESDMSFLTRLAGLHDAVAKPAAGKLIFAMRGEAKSVGGKAMPIISLSGSDITRWSYKRSARKAEGGGDHQGDIPKPTGGTRAYWWDFDEGKRQEVTAGDPPYSTIRFVHASKSEAMDAAKARKNTGDRGQAELSISLPGRPQLAAECKLAIDLRPSLPALWVVKRVKHQLNLSGFATQADAELPSGE
jgi:hypothetical protein